MSKFAKKALVIVAVVFLAVTMLSVAHAATVLGSPVALDIIGPSAQITWTTNEPSTSYVHYGTSTGSFTDYSTSRCDAGGDVVSHCVNLTGLSPNTFYYFKAISCASGAACGELYGSPFTTSSGSDVQNSGGTTTTTTTAGTAPAGSIPQAPSNVRLNDGSTMGQISLLWDDNASSEDKWNVERKLTTGSAYSPLAQTLGANITTYTDTTASPGTSYDYRVQACLSGYGCSAYAYLGGVGMQLTTVSTTSMVQTNEATTTYKEYVLRDTGGDVASSDSAMSATSAGTTSGTGIETNISVLSGNSYCDGSIGKTPLTFSVTPYGGAFFKFSMVSPTAATTIFTNGTYQIPNGTYRFEAVAYSGHVLSGKTSGEFTLNQTCRSVTATDGAVADKTTEIGNKTEVVPVTRLNVRPSEERGSTEFSETNVRPSEERGSTEFSETNVRPS